MPNNPIFYKYTEAICRETYSFRTLTHLKPVFDNHGNIVFLLIGVDVIFKMFDTKKSEFVAVKCFASEQLFRKTHYCKIEEFFNEEYKMTSIPFLLNKYECYSEELLINTDFEVQRSCDILIYDWVEGCTLFHFLKLNCSTGNVNAVKQIAEEFDRLAIWLIKQNFVYVNLNSFNVFKPINSDYLILLDYENIYLPTCSSGKEYLLGSLESKYCDFEKRNIANEYKSVLSLSLSLHVLVEHPDWFTIYSKENSLIFKEEDFDNIDSDIFHKTRYECKSWIVQKRLLGLLHTLVVPEVTCDSMHFYLQPLPTYTKRLIPWVLVDVNERHNWGFVNWKKEIIVACIYDYVEPFYDGLSIVKRGGKKGIINEIGIEITPCIYASIGKFKEGFAKVEIKINNRYRAGLINRLGEEITAFNYDEVNDFSEDLARVKKNGKEGYIDKNGKEIVSCIYEKAFDIREGVATVVICEGLFQDSENKNEKYGFVDKFGQEFVAPYYDDTSGFRKNLQGFAQVKFNSKWGLIDKNGKEIVLCIYDNFGWSFRDNFLMVNKNKKWGFVNIKGEEVIPCIFDNVNDFYEEMAGVEKKGKWGFVNNKGEECVPCIYSYDNNSFFTDGLARVKKKSKYGFINKMGKEVISCVYDFISYNFVENMVSVCKNNKWGFIDKLGNEVVPCIYDGFNYNGKNDFSEGLAKVCKNEKWGFVDKLGHEIIACYYDDVRSFNQGVAAVKKRNKWGLIDKSEKEIIPLIYEEISNFQDGLVRVRKNKKYGFVDKTGFEVIPCDYDIANDFEHGLAWVESEVLRTRFLIDKMGVEYWSWPES